MVASKSSLSRVFCSAYRLTLTSSTDIATLLTSRVLYRVLSVKLSTLGSEFLTMVFFLIAHFIYQPIKPTKSQFVYLYHLPVNTGVCLSYPLAVIALISKLTVIAVVTIHAYYSFVASATVINVIAITRLILSTNMACSLID